MSEREDRAQLRAQLVFRVLDVIEAAIQSGSEVLIAACHALRSLPPNQPDLAFRWLDGLENRLRVLEGRAVLPPFEVTPSGNTKCASCGTWLSLKFADRLAAKADPSAFDPARDCGEPLPKGVCQMPIGHDGPHMNMFNSKEREGEQPGEPAS